MTEESDNQPSIEDLFSSPAESPQPAKPVRSDGGSGKKTILVAEDDDRLRSLLAEIMRRENYQVEEAADGQDALQIALETHVDLVISDLMMPRMNGWRLLSSLRENNLDVPVIILTGHMTEEGERVLTSKDIVGFLSKPVKFDDLRKLVSAVFAGSAADRKPRVLAADDSEDTRLLVETFLDKAGFEVKTLDRGSNVLLVVESFRPDLVILDLVMPEMDGFEVCDELRGNPDTADMPVILLTAKASQAYIKKAVSLGVIGYIVKPFTEDLLVTRVKRALQGSRYRRSTGN